MKYLTLTWGSTDSPVVLASRLAFAIGSCSTPGAVVGGVVNGAIMTLAPCQAGTSYYLEGGLDQFIGGTSADFAMALIVPTYPGVSSGAVYDAGTVNLTVNGAVVASAPYNSGSTPVSLAAALAASGSGNGLVTLSSNEAGLTMTSEDDGSDTDYSYAVTVDDTAYFAQPSFAASSMAGDLTGGQTVPLYNWAIDSYAPDGDVLSMTDSVMGAWHYTYDDMNRLTSGDASSGTMAGLDLGWTYDRYGNRWGQNATGSGNGTVVQTNMTFSGNNNRIDGYQYDADGNLLNDGRHSYVYDAENRIVTLDGQPTYVYDAEGRRVAKYSGGSIIATYILGLGGEQLTEWNNVENAWAHSNVYAAGGKLLATYDGSGGTAAAGYHYHLTDWLGTERMQTGSSGNEDEVCTSYPFGDGLSCTGPHATDATEQHFTGKERDAESGLDYFGARYLSSNFGRFMTPDWAAAPTDVPYAKFGDPQSLNLYAYVGNNPNIGIDADGHFVEPTGAAQVNAAQAQADQAFGTQTFGGAPDQGSASTPGAATGSGSGSGSLGQGQTANLAQQQTPQGNPGQPTGADGKPAPPPVPMPGAPGTPWVWQPDPNNDRGGTWGPGKGNWDHGANGNAPSGSWEEGQNGKPGHWDVDNGRGRKNGGRSRYGADGTPIPDGQQHRNISIPAPSPGFAAKAANAAMWVGAAIVFVAYMAVREVTQ